MTEPAKLRDDAIARPHPDRFSPGDPGYEASMSAHRVAVEAGQQGYLDPTTGLFVMTATHLADRPCCENRCRHCPWLADD